MELYERYLSPRDFGVSRDTFDAEIAILRWEELVKKANCAWRRDSDGNLVADGVLPADTYLRIVITPEAFVVEPNAGRRPTVFLSYAREDYVAAERTERALADAGFAVWLDKHALYGGQPWRQTIKRAIRESDFFVALFSRDTERRRTFFHAEVRCALEVREELPEGGVFLVPVRLDETTPSFQAIGEIQWVDFFPDFDDGTVHLIRGLRHARK